jgi:hypothetical protein
VLKNATPGDYAVAEMTVCSRAFEVAGAGRGGRSTHALVPLADMLNTALPHTCDVDFGTLMVDGQLVFQMNALRDIPAGIQIYDSYGLKSNDRYLLNYGFSFEGNALPNGKNPNEVSLVINPPSDASKINVWGKAGFRIALSEGPLEAGAAKAMSLLRFLMATPPELERLFRTHLRGLGPAQPSDGYFAKRKASDRAARVKPTPLEGADDEDEDGEDVEESAPPPVDARVALARLANIPTLSTFNEAAAYGELARYCAEALATYPQASSHQHPRYSNAWNARVQIDGEKRILEHWLHFSHEKATSLHAESLVLNS